MSDQRFQTSNTPNIHVSRCQGDLSISGRMGQAVDLSGVKFTAEMAELNQITVASDGELDIHVPSDSGLTLDQVQGQIIIKHVTGHLTIKEASADIHLKNLCSVTVHTAQRRLIGENVDGPITIIRAQGNVELRNVGQVQIERAEGDVQVQYVTGSLDIGPVLGSLNVHTVSGDLSVTEVHGEAQLTNLGGHNSLPRVDREIYLAGSLASGEHTFTANGNIIVRWPFDAPISLIATASQVRCLLDLENKVESVGEEQLTTLTGHIEEGQAILSLKTHAKIGIMSTYDSGAEPLQATDFAFDFEPAPQQPVSETDRDASAATYKTGAPASLGEKLSDAITTRLRQAGVEMNPIQLKQLVTAAVASSLLDMPEIQAAAPVDVSSRRPSAGQIAAESARQAVEGSLRQAKESLERIRRQGQPTPGQKPPSASRKRSAAAKKKKPPLIPREEKMVTEEQLNILNLLRDGHITAQQAKTLLDALEK